MQAPLVPTTVPTVPLPLMTVEDALSLLVAWLRNSSRDPHAVQRELIVSTLDLQSALSAVISERLRREQAASSRGMTTHILDFDTNAEPSHAAAWELCRRGVLRPRVFRDVGDPSRSARCRSVGTST